MDWKDIAGMDGKVAPALGAVLAPATGGVSAVIGTAVGALAKAFGIEGEATPEVLEKAIATDPQAALKLMLAEQEFNLKLKTLEIEELKAYLGDVDSARGRQVEHEKITGKSDKNLYILAWVIVIGFFVLLAFLLFVPVPEDQNGVIFMLFGALATGFGQVLQYFFGSSKSSAEKNEQIGLLRKQLGKS